MKKAPLAEFRGVSKGFGKKLALDTVTLTIGRSLHQIHCKLPAGSDLFRGLDECKRHSEHVRRIL